MRVSGIGAAAIGTFSRRAADRYAATPAAAPESRALIAVAASTASDRATARARHPQAPFLAQLIATQLHLPQTRARRRAEPAEAIAAYRAHGDARALSTFHRQG
jgi:hypothetical protein